MKLADGRRVELKVRTHFTEVNYLPKNLLKLIDYRMSAPYPNFWYSTKYKMGLWDGKKHFFDIYKHTIPTGLLNMFTQILRDYRIDYVVLDLRRKLDIVKPVTKLGDKDLASSKYSYQLDAVKAALRNGTGVIEVATGGGKTIIAAAIIASLRKKTLYAVGSKDIYFQTLRELRKHLPDMKICEWKARFRDCDVVVGMIQTMTKATSYGFKDYDVFIVDEAHHVPAYTWEKLARRVNARYRFGLSGTAFGDDLVRDYTLMATMGDRLIKVTNADLIDRGVGAKPIINFITSESDEISNELRYSSVVSVGISRNYKRNNQIVNLICKLAESDENILVITGYKIHALNLYKMLDEAGMKGNLYLVTGSTNDFIRSKSMEEFRANGGVVIATTVYDEGVDFPDVTSLVLCGGGKKERRLLQRLGRGLRATEKKKKVDVYDFYDWYNKYLAEHSLSRLKTYVREGFEVYGLDSKSAEWIRKNVS